MKTDKRLPVPLTVSIQYGAAFAFMYIFPALFMPFFPLWLAENNITAAEIGIIFAVGPIVRSIVPPFVTQWADTHNSIKGPMVLCQALATASFVFFFWGSGFWQFLLISTIVSIFLTPQIPLMDTACLMKTKNHRMSYPIMRAIGSMGFVFFSIVMGFYFKKNGVDDILLWMTLGLVLSLVSMMSLQVDRSPTKTDNLQSLTDDQRNPLKYLLKDKQFVLFLWIVSLIQFSHGIVYSIGSVHWRNNGITEDQIGILWAVGVTAEILLFLFCGKLVAHLRPRTIFSIVAIFGALRWVITGISVDFEVLFFAQMIHSLTFGATHLAAVYYISSRLPVFCAATAQGLYSGICMGFAVGIGMLGGGYLYDLLTGQGIFGGYAYFAMAASCALVLPVVYKLQRRT